MWFKRGGGYVRALGPSVQVKTWEKPQERTWVSGLLWGGGGMVVVLVRDEMLGGLFVVAFLGGQGTFCSRGFTKGKREAVVDEGDGSHRRGSLGPVRGIHRGWGTRRSRYREESTYYVTSGLGIQSGKWLKCNRSITLSQGSFSLSLRSFHVGHSIPSIVPVEIKPAE